MIKKVIGALFFVSLLIYARQGVTVAPFNVGAIIERVSHHPVKEGARIVIKDRVYEAFFDEKGVVLKAKSSFNSPFTKGGKGGLEDLVIPISGKPEIRDGKIVYPTSYGEIAFEGTSRGLRYEELGHSSVFTSTINKYTGNVARLCHSEERSDEESREMLRSTQHDRNDEIATLPSVARNDNYSEYSTTGEFLLDTNVVYVLDPNLQGSPAVTFDGVNYFVVWCNVSERFGDIYGARVSQAGTVLDLAGIAISTAQNNQYGPSVAFDGSSYIVVWTDCRNGGSIDDIYGARVSRSGIVLDPIGIAITTSAYGQQFPSVAFDGTNYLVVWTDYGGGAGANICGSRVSRAGIVLDGIVISNAPGEQLWPSVAFGGANYLAAWEDQRSGTSDIYGARVSRAGAVLDPSGIAISTASNTQYYPSVISDGTNYLVVWEDLRSGSDIYGARVSQTSTVLDPSGIAICTVANIQNYPSVAFDGANYLTVWGDSRGGSDTDIYGARVSRAGVVLDPSGFGISTATNTQYRPSIVFGGANYLVVWADYRHGSYSHLYGTRVSPIGAILEPAGIVITMSANNQGCPSVAFDGANYLIVWQDNRRTGHSCDIYGLRVSCTGSILDQSAIAISTAVNTQEKPSIAFDGITHFVVWEDSRSGSFDIYGARVSQGGFVLDPNGIAISTASNNQMAPAVVFCGINYLVAWGDERSLSDLYGARVSVSGTVLDPNGIAISTAASIQECPSVAFDGTNCLVVWHDGRNGGIVFDIYGARVSQSGILLDPSGIAISTAQMDQKLSSVAFDNTNYFVVWQDYRNIGFWDIYGARVSQTGIVLDPNGIAISTVRDGQEVPTVTFDGSNYVVAWEDWRSTFYSDIYCAKLNTSGLLIDSFAVSTQSGNQISPSIAHGQGDQVFVVYSGWTDSINHLPANTMRIWGKLLAPVGIEEDAQRLTLNATRFLEVYPNPFRVKTVINYALSTMHQKDKELPVIRIYDACGKLVKSFSLPSAYCLVPTSFTWDGDDDFGRALPAGVYFCRLEAGNVCLTKKVVKLE